MSLPTTGAEPILVQGGAADWPAASWSLMGLADRLGDARLPVYTGRWRSVLGRIRRDGATTTRHAATVLSQLEQGESPGYLAGWQILRAAPTLRDDLRYPDVGPIYVDIVWIGPAGMCTPAHVDRVSNLYVQVSGEKRWDFWRPDRRLRGRVGLTGSSMSLTDVASPADMPAPDRVVTLGPGDVLFIPPSWWHRVTTVETGISISRWWFGRLARWHVAIGGRFRRSEPSSS